MVQDINVVIVVHRKEDLVVVVDLRWIVAMPHLVVLVEDSRLDAILDEEGLDVPPGQPVLDVLLSPTYRL